MDSIFFSGEDEQYKRLHSQLLSTLDEEAGFDQGDEEQQAIFSSILRSSFGEAPAPSSALEEENSALKDEVLQLAREVERLRAQERGASDEETFGPRAAPPGEVSFFGSFGGAGAAAPVGPCTECEGLRAEVKRLASQLQDIQSQSVRDAAALKERHDRRFNEQKKENEALRLQMDKLTVVLDDAKAERKSLAKSLKQERSALDSMKRESQKQLKAAEMRFEKRNVDFKSQIKALNTESKKKLASRESALQNIIKDKDRLASELKLSSRSAERLAQEAVKARERAELEAKEAREARDRAVGERDAAQKKLKLKADSLDVAQAHVKELRSTIAKLKKKNASNASKKGNSSALQTEIKDAEMAKEVAQRTLTSALKKLKASTERCEALEATVAELKESAEARTDNSSTLVTASPSRARLLEARLAHAERELAEVQENSARVHRAMMANLEQMMEEEREATAAKEAAWQAEREQLLANAPGGTDRKVLRKVAERSDKMREMQKKSLDEVESLRLKLSKLQVEHQKVIQRCSALEASANYKSRITTEMHGALEQQRQTLKEREEEIAQLQQDLQILSQGEHGETSLLMRAKKHVQKLQAERDELQRRLEQQQRE